MTTLTELPETKMLFTVAATVVGVGLDALIASQPVTAVEPIFTCGVKDPEEPPM